MLACGVAALGTLGFLLAAPGAGAADGAAAALERLVAQGCHPWVTSNAFAAQETAIRGVYEGRAFAPLWIQDSRPSAAARSVIAALQAAEARGLRPADYAAPRLLDAQQRLDAQTADADAAAEYDCTLTAATMRYAADAYQGRVNPHAADLRSDGSAKQPLDLAVLIPALAASPGGDAPARALASLDPPFAAFARLRDALAHYRALAARADVAEVPALPKLRPDDRDAGIPALRARLAALGDLPAEAAVASDPEQYDPALVAAVQHFQTRHGLDADGIIGPATLRALRTPLTERVAQIELAMERLRWLPYRWPSRFVFVNIPEFRLRGFTSGDGAPALIMNVVVGEAAAAQKHKTPVLQADMTYVVFRPTWAVPPGIARQELLPKIERDPSYLERHRMIMVDGRIRQLPGRNNALGLIKFIFPNRYHVYLHDTPAKALFARARRDFSHGCIRVADPLGLAEFVLRDTPPGWDRTRIERAMRDGANNRHVTLATPVPVYLFYTTVVVEESSQVNFFEDIYGHDAALLRQLADAR